MAPLHDKVPAGAATLRLIYDSFEGEAAAKTWTPLFPFPRNCLVSAHLGESKDLFGRFLQRLDFQIVQY